MYIFDGVTPLDSCYSLRWRHNELDGVSDHQPHECLLNRLFWCRSKKTAKLCVTGLCAGNSPGSVNSPHKWPVTRKKFPFDDVIMTELFLKLLKILCNTCNNETRSGLSVKGIIWRRHQIETFSALMASCAGNSPFTSEFPAQRPVKRSFDVLFDLRLNIRLSKQLWGWWFETPSRSTWRHYNDYFQVASSHLFTSLPIANIHGRLCTVVTLFIENTLDNGYYHSSCRLLFSLANAECH